MKQKLLFTSGILQILWSVLAFFFGSISFGVVVFIVSKGGIFPETPTEPLSILQILVFLSVGLIILIGCAAVLYFGIILTRTSKYKKLAIILSTVILYVPPALGIYILIKSSLGAMILVSPIFILLLAPIVIIIINFISMFIKQEPYKTA